MKMKLVVEGTSLAASYRTSFRQQLQQRDLDALIADLAARTGQGCKGTG
ncbi:MAG: ABC transporter substrate-binding protein [Chromatocurvus sp.]